MSSLLHFSSPNMQGQKRQRTSVSKVSDADESAATASVITPAEGRQQGLALLDFINNSWTPYHAVDQTSRRLLAAGFQQINERDQWKIKAGGRYFFSECDDASRMQHPDLTEFNLHMEANDQLGLITGSINSWMFMLKLLYSTQVCRMQGIQYDPV